MTVGLRNPTSQVRGDQVFGNHSSATSGYMALSDNDFPNDNFFSDVSNLVVNLNMGR
jgi:hypothetical protein